jgi:hypothetical protein
MIQGGLIPGKHATSSGSCLCRCPNKKSMWIYMNQENPPTPNSNYPLVSRKLKKPIPAPSSHEDTYSFGRWQWAPATWHSSVTTSHLTDSRRDDKTFYIVSEGSAVFRDSSNMYSNDCNYHNVLFRSDSMELPGSGFRTLQLTNTTISQLLCLVWRWRG